MKWLTWFSIATLAGMAWAASASDILPKDMRAEDVYWSDADSGRLNGEKFRLANVDAPEKGGVGSIGGAKCEVERERAFDAKDFIVTLTRDADVRIARNYGPDRYGRMVVDLEVNGQSLAEVGLEAGVYKPWPHKGQRALSRKPDWCGKLIARK